MREKTKLILSLIKRIEVRLPINNAETTIESLEQDTLIQQSVAAVIELSIYQLSVVVNQLAHLLDLISKDIHPSASVDAHVPVDVIQSQLFILRLLSACMQYHWNWYRKNKFPEHRKGNTTNGTIESDIKISGSKKSKEEYMLDPPPLDDASVSFLLTLLGRFLNQYHVLEEQSDLFVMSSSECSVEAIAAVSNMNPVIMEHIREIYNSSGKVIRYVSASNWNLFYPKIKKAVNILVSVSDNSVLNPPEIRILAFTELNLEKLHTILTELSPYFLNMKTQGKLLFAKMLRNSIWKWIETRPAEFASLFIDRKKPILSPEVLFDMCNEAADSSRKKATLWPLQIILLTLSPDLLVQAFFNDRGTQNRRAGFQRQLRKALESARTQDIAATCYIDLCKVASFVSPDGDNILRQIVDDIEDILKEKVWDFSRSPATDALSSSLGYTINQQTLVSAYLLSQLRLNLTGAIQAHIPSLLDEESPAVFRQAFVDACLSIASEEHSLPWYAPLHSMYDSICSPLRRIFIQTVKLELSSRSDVSSISLNSRRASGIERKVPNTPLLLQSLLKLFRLDSGSALMGVDEKLRIDENILLMSSLTALIKHPDNHIKQGAVSCLVKLYDPSIIVYWAPSKSIMSVFWKVSSHTISCIARKILDNTRQNEELMKTLFNTLASILESRYTFLTENLEPSIVQEPHDFHERSQAMVTLEVALLVSLCSPFPEICSQTVTCIGYLCKESRLLEENTFGDSASRSSQSTYMYNYNIEIYERLCCEEPNTSGLRKQLFVGRKAQQKRFRKYLRMMTAPTSSNLLAWEEAWRRWKGLTPAVIRYGMDTLPDTSDISTIFSSTMTSKKIGAIVKHDKLRASTIKSTGSFTSTSISSPIPVSRVEIDDEKQAEWQNYTGFLAALGGCRLSMDSDNESLGEKSISGRSSSPALKTHMLAERFITEMVDLLTSENVIVREAVKDTLGGSLSAALYIVLFREIENRLGNYFESNGDIACSSTSTLFVEQSVLVLKTTLDRLTDPSDFLVSVDFSTIVLYFVNYINRLPHDNYTTMRTMIMMCHLIEVLMKKMDQIIIRDDVRVKNRILETIINWTSDFKSGSSETNSLQNKEVQRDLDQVCLKAIVALLNRLPLQTSEQSRIIDKSLNKSNLFQKYFKFLIDLIERCNQFEAENMHSFSSQPVFSISRQFIPAKPIDSYWGPIKESSVNALSNLLNANVEVGLKFILAMGYHEDPKMRNACMQILTNILNAGAQFDTLDDTVTNDRYEKLVETLVESDMDVALSVCDVCPASDASTISNTLLTVFESKNKLLPVLKAIVEREVSYADQESTLFRGTNMATRMLSTFSRNVCVDYVKITIQPAIENVNALSDEELTWEMDPIKEKSPDQAILNKQNVCRVTDILLSAICNSASNAPSIFRTQLSFLVEAVNKRFSDVAEIQVGGFVFLRLFNPAILTLEGSATSKKAIPRSKNVRKILLQATRLMQNLANNVMFGAKEPHLISLNDFITNNLYRVTHFLREISIAAPPTSQEANHVILDMSTYSVLHRYMSENLEKISRHVSGPRSRASYGTEKILELKRTMERFSNILGQLGPPPEIAQEESTMIRNYAITSSNSNLKEFMRNKKNFDINSVQSLNIMYQSGVTRKGHPVFYFIARSMYNVCIDFENLIFYWLRTMEPFLDQPFEMVVDLSYLNEGCELPAHWINKFFSLIGKEIATHLVHLHFFNANFYSRNYYNGIPRAMFDKIAKRIKFSQTTQGLSQYIVPSEIRLPKTTCDIENEAWVISRAATLQIKSQQLIPVTLKIGKEHIQIITSQEHELFFGLYVIMNELYYINELYSVSLPPIVRGKKKSNEGEMQLAFNQGKTKVILYVSNREEVYKYLLNYKKAIETNSIEEKDSIRPNDVPGRILNMALLNMGSCDPTLRLSSYGLLCSISVYYRFKIASSTIHSRDIFIPYNDSQFITNISQNIALDERHLTLEFLSECIVGLEKSNADTARQILALEYMSPWLENIHHYIYDGDGWESKKVKEIIRSLIAFTIGQPKLQGFAQEKVWKSFTKMEETHAIIMECIVQYSVENGFGSAQTESAANILVTMNCNSIRGKIVSRIRKALQSTSQNCQQSLTKHPAWVEIACLMRIMITLSFYYISSGRPLVAESFHIVALLASTGPTLIRSSVHGFLVNIIHLLVTSDPVTNDNRNKLQYLMNDVGDGKYRVHFGLNKSYANAFTITDETMSDSIESISLSSLEVIVRLLLEVAAAATSDQDTLNRWRSRWMSLATSMTFQFNPILQPRAFVILGCLAQEEMDDDLMFQILIVLRNDLSNFNEKNPELIISILMCLKNIVDNLPGSSRYLLSIFWLAISLIQINHHSIFSHSVKLLHATLRNMSSSGFFDKRSIENVTMAARNTYLSVLSKTDIAAGVNFETHFSFAIAGSLLKGIIFSDCREVIFECLASFLEIESKTGGVPNRINSRCLGYFVGLLPFFSKCESIDVLLHMAGITNICLDKLKDPASTYSVIWEVMDIPNDPTGTLLVSLLAGLLSIAQTEMEKVFLFGILSKIAASTPEVFALVYDSIIPKMNAVVSSSNNPILMETVKKILVTACSNPAFSVTEKLNQQKRSFEGIAFAAFEETHFGNSVPVSVSTKLASELLRMICE
ncbi:hypothetical protein BY458DRAFT_182532 [Sporodiniella umbellata]|nr:hypothetical protein BY458DRAFT_182532 [Sporodiniella umbellata]